MWIVRGLKKGVITGRYPEEVREEELPPYVPAEAPRKCPFGAVRKGRLDLSACLYCGLCNVGFERRTEMSRIENPLTFRRSLHVFFLDVGTCHLCNREVSLLTGPHYDIHRLGIFFVPTPKHADVLLVAGCPTEEMVPVLREAYELMPEPKRVVVMGSCAQGAICRSRVEDHVPVDGYIDGCPPSPISVMDGLLKVAGRSER
ncbi:MAG: NADH:ubiquinone oxidoreductase [Thermococci archaeon]|nr:NADH:ubiquinone oxidoreductase [Thermococci archaeon]